MRFLRPRSLQEALEVKSSCPDAVVVAGGTDVMVQVNFGRLRPPMLVDLSAVEDLRALGRTEDGRIRIGAAMPLSTVALRLSDELVGLCMAARTVGSPQIRNRATLGGNLGTASPAGDTLPPLVAAGAKVELASHRGHRMMLVEDFLVAPKHTAAEPDELLVAVHVPPRSGPQQFSKVGSRNAMVISVAGLATELRCDKKQLCCAVGSAAPTVRRVRDAEKFAADLPWPETGSTPTQLDPELVRTFGRIVRDAADPIDDIRGTAEYRRRALEVLARRSLTWAWADLRRQQKCA